MSFDLHPIVGDWFAERFGSATEPQERAWPAIRSGENVLISAPTGSGKTLAAFLICLDDLVRAGLDGRLPDTTQVLYVSPLKALSNDIHKNLDVPLSGIAALAAERGLMLPAIRTAVRTGDTPTAERQRMIKHPPHILVTTPESLFILLTADRSRQALRSVKTVIVDEIHAMADDKRGAHLALSLARLDDLVEKAGGPRPQRIGLSATVRPIEIVARFLAPDEHAKVDIINHGHRRAMDLAVEVPQDELGPVASNEMWQEIYDRITALIQEHRTTLVFVNTRTAGRARHASSRRAAWRRRGARPSRQPVAQAAADCRREAQNRKAEGGCRHGVARARHRHRHRGSRLPDRISAIDRRCAAAHRPVGTSGRAHDQAEGADLRDDARRADRMRRAGPRDLAGRARSPAGAGDAARRDGPANRRHGRRRGLAGRRSVRAHSPRLLLRRSDARGFRRRDRHAVRGHQHASAAAAARFCIAIACTESSAAGAGRVWRRSRRAARFRTTRSSSSSRSRTKRSSARSTRISPSRAWPATCSCSARRRGASAASKPAACAWKMRKAPRRRFRSGAAKRRAGPGSCRRAVSDLRAAILEKASDSVPAAIDFLVERLPSRHARRRAGCSLRARRRGGARCAARASTTVVAERFFDEGGGMQLVLHSPFGARINRAWGLALRKRFCRSFNFELQAAATDNGIVISLSDQHSFPLELVFKFLSKETVEDVLTQAMLPAPMFEARWRWDASRALAVLRFAGGRKVPPQIQRMRADDLLAAVFPDQAACQENIVGDIRIPDHPLVNETIKDCLHEAMDLDGLKQLIEDIGTGALKTVAIDTPEPSPFSHEILNANPYAYLDDAPLEERRARAVQMRRTHRARRRRRRRARPCGDCRSRCRVVSRRARRGRAARCAAHADRRAAGSGVGRVFHDAPRIAAGNGSQCRRREFLGRGRAAEVGALALPGLHDRSRYRRPRSHADIRSGVGGDRDPARLAGIERTADAEQPLAAIRPAHRGDGGGAPPARS